MWKIFLIFLVIPSFVSAKTYQTINGTPVEVPVPKNIIWREFVLPSGISYVAQQLIPIAKADTLSLQEEIELWLKSYALQFNISENYFLRLAKCESGLDPNAVGDKGKALGIFQWWKHSWDFYNLKYKTDLDRENWKDQVVMSAKVISLEGYDNWVNCWYFIRFNKWK